MGTIHVCVERRSTQRRLYPLARTTVSINLSFWLRRTRMSAVVSPSRTATNQEVGRTVELLPSKGRLM